MWVEPTFLTSSALMSVTNVMAGRTVDRWLVYWCMPFPCIVQCLLQYLSGLSHQALKVCGHCCRSARHWASHIDCIAQASFWGCGREHCADHIWGHRDQSHRWPWGLAGQFSYPCSVYFIIPSAANVFLVPYHVNSPVSYIVSGPWSDMVAGYPLSFDFLLTALYLESSAAFLSG